MPRYRHPHTGSTIDTSEADFRDSWQGKGFVLDDPDAPDAPAGEGAEPAAATAPAETEDAATEPDLAGMKRADLEAYAASHGVADPSSYPNKEALIEAIRGGGGEGADLGTGETADPDERTAEGAVDEHGRPV